jgi:hypothetical protein
LQNEADEFGLTPRAGLVEHMSEVCPRRRQRDAEAVRRRLQPVGFQHLAREPGFRRGQPEIVAEAFAADDDGLLRIGDE